MPPKTKTQHCRAKFDPAAGIYIFVLFSLMVANILPFFNPTIKLLCRLFSPFQASRIKVKSLSNYKKEFSTALHFKTGLNLVQQ